MLHMLVSTGNLLKLLCWLTEYQAGSHFMQICARYIIHSQTRDLPTAHHS